MTGHEPWREIKHKRDIRLAAEPILPWRGHVDFCFAGPDEGDVLERVTAALEAAGVMVQNGGIELMATADVLPGSPLEAQLAAASTPSRAGIVSG